MQENCDWNMAWILWQKFPKKTSYLNLKSCQNHPWKEDYASCLLIERVEYSVPCYQVVDKSPEYSVAYEGVAYKKNWVYLKKFSMDLLASLVA